MKDHVLVDSSERQDDRLVRFSRKNPKWAIRYLAQNKTWYVTDETVASRSTQF